jgi:glutathione peroxidase-family protein
MPRLLLASTAAAAAIFTALNSSRRPLTSMAATSFYDLTAQTIKGQDYPFSTLRGKVVLIVNTASECGFTVQYDGLEALHKKYKDQGLVVLGFPCNQFGGQEPGGAEEIQTFCKKNFGVSFQIMDKIDVNGDNTHPVYVYLKSKKSFIGLSRIKWNFEKFLIDRSGTVKERYISSTTPEQLDADVAKLIAEAEPEQKASSL